jgi:hypothetical protein
MLPLFPMQTAVPQTTGLTLPAAARAKRLPPPPVGEGRGGGAPLANPRAKSSTVPPSLTLPHAGGGKLLVQALRPTPEVAA